MDNTNFEEAKPAALEFLEIYSKMSPEQQKQVAPVFGTVLGVQGIDWVVKNHPNYATAIIFGLCAALGFAVTR